MSRIIRWISGWLTVILFAIFWSRMVLPAFGGETISPLCPLPMGQIRSIILMEISEEVVFELDLFAG